MSHNRHSITKGYFSGKHVLRVWDRHGATVHNSIHDLPEHARAALDDFLKAEQTTAEEAIAEEAIAALPQISMEEGLRSRTGLPTPNVQGATS